MMGFFDSLKKAVKETAEKARRESSADERPRGALPPGRMRETDEIKGKDSPIPNAPGIYRHINKVTGKVEYAGQTDDLRRRQQEHEREGKLDTERQKVAFKVARPDADKDDLCQAERDHIARHKPSGNKTKGGNGRR